MIMKLVTDFASWVYFVETVVCGAGFAIFLWWWIRQKTASEVYSYITLLLLATAVERAAAFSMRCLLFHDPEKAYESVLSLSWALRTLPGTVIMCLIVFRMANRAWRTVRLEKKYQDREGEENECVEDYHESNQ